MNDKEVNDLIDGIFAEVEIATATVSTEIMEAWLASMGVADFKIKHLPDMLRHPASSGTVRMRFGDVDNYVSIHTNGDDFHYHVLSVPIELDIEL